MVLNLRCVMCDNVRESLQDTDELREVEADDIRPDIFVCSDCLSEEDEPSPAPRVLII